VSKDLTDLQLLHELEPVVEANLNRHLSMRDMQIAIANSHGTITT
jgi:hypothetical protein